MTLAEIGLLLIGAGLGSGCVLLVNWWKSDAKNDMINLKEIVEKNLREFGDDIDKATDKIIEDIFTTKKK